MRLGVIADDFTGASDIALTLAEGGMATVLGPGAEGGDAAVIPLKSRTAPVAEAVAASLAAADRLTAAGARQIVFKVCSTFDSTAEGNIGPVLDALCDRGGAAGALVCPAFPEAGRSVYMGHLFVGDRLLSESGMERHPLTPMTDPNLRRVLAAQSRRPVGHLPLATVRAGVGAVREALAAAPGHLIADAVAEADLRTLGAAASKAPVICGGSGIALGLPATAGHAPAVPPWDPAPGPGAVLSGSCSRATRGQVAAWSGAAREITAEAAMAGMDVGALADWAAAKAPALVYSSADPEAVAAAQARFGRAAVADRLEALFADLARRLVAAGIRRLVVAGGETSGAVVEGLGLAAMRVGPRLAAGVPALAAADRPLALALKSGNFGGPGFFAEALDRLGPPA